MTDHTLDQGYGHLGPAIYDEEQKEWQYGRTFELGRELKPCGIWQRLVPDANESNSTEVQSDSEPAGKRSAQWTQQHSKDLFGFSKKYPELQLAQSFFLPLLRESESVQANSDAFDLRRGDLMACGFISSAGSSDNSPIQVLAIPAGSNGSDLKLYRIDEHVEYGWDDGLTQLLTALPVNAGSSWIGPGVPIRQITFSKARPMQNKITGGFLAVRLWKEIVVFRPVLHRGPNSFSGNLSSHINLQPLVVISGEMVGGLRQDDVNFNPWNDRELAIADASGEIAVFEITAPDSAANALRQEYGLINLRFYHVPSETDDTESQKSLYRDWVRLLWISNSNTVMLCTRVGFNFIHCRRMATIDPEPPMPKLGLGPSSDWMLDVKSHPLYLDQVFILTSAHIFWLHVCLEGQSYSDYGANIVAAIRHFRGPSDLSLKLTVSISAKGGSEFIDDFEYTSQEQCVDILLSSRMNDMITSYRLRDSNDAGVVRSMLCHPASLVLQAQNSGTKTANISTLDLCLRSVSYIDRTDIMAPPGFATSLRDNGIKMYSLQMLSSDFKLYNHFLWSAEEPLSILGIQGLELAGPIVHTKPYSESGESYQNDFVVSDLPRTETLSVASSRRKSRKTAPSTKSDTPKGASDMRSVYKLLHTSSPSTQTEDSGSQLVDAVAAMRALFEDLERRPESCGEPMQNLIELLPRYSSVSDVDRASDAFHKLLQLVVPADAVDETPLVVTRIFNASSFSSPPQEAILLNIYRSIIRNMLAPLPPNIPGRFRLTLEAQARIMSADVCLASTRVELQKQDEDTGEGDASGTLDLPSQRSNGNFLSSQSIPVSSQLSTTSSGRVPSQIPQIAVAGYQSSTASPSVHATTISASTIQASYANLRRYVAFSKPLPVPRAQAARPLAHWTVGVDPALYSWTATQRAIENFEDAAVEQSGLTAKEKNRLRKRAEHHLKKQRQEDRKREERVAGLSSQLTVTSSSTRGEPITSIPSAALESQTFSLPFISSHPVASQSQPSQMPAIASSQISSGARGRIGPPPRKKKRAGF